MSDLELIGDGREHGSSGAPVRVQVAGVLSWEQAGRDVQFVTVTAALEHALDAFDAHPLAAGAFLRADAGAVSLYPRRDKTVVVVGRNRLADAVRDALPVGNWQCHVLTSSTLLSVLRDRLGTRTFALLRREGFTSLEEVTAVPDRGLLDIRSMGSTTISTLRLLAAEDRIGADGGPVTLSEYHAGELLMLLKVLLTHVKPQRKDELAQAVSTFINEALPGARKPEAPSAGDGPGGLELSG